MDNGRSSAKPHIALFINSMRKGGAERVMANLAEYLFSRGWKVTLVTTWFDPPEYALPHALWNWRTGMPFSSPKGTVIPRKAASTDTGNDDHTSERGLDISGLDASRSARDAEGITRIYSEPPAEALQGNRLQNFKVRYQTIRDIWEQERPDLILSFIGMTNIMAILTARGLHIPVVVSVRSTRELEYDTAKLRMLSDHVYPHAAGIVFQTAITQDSFPARIRRKSVVLPNSVNPAFMQPRFEGRRDPVIVSVGRLDENKNQGMLIRAFAAVRKDFPGIRLQLFGDGPAREAWKDLARSLGLRVLDRKASAEPDRKTAGEGWRSGKTEGKTDEQTDPTTAGKSGEGTLGKDPVLQAEQEAQADVIFEGEVDNIPDRIRRASVYVLCSNIEGMPNSLIEAMSLGLACISTDCAGGGPASLIESGINGYLVPPGDTAALEEKLRHLLGSADEIDRIGRNAAAVQQDYDPAKINAAWESYLLSRLK